MKHIKTYENKNNDYSKYVLYYKNGDTHIFEVLDVINTNGKKKYKIKYLTSYFDSGFSESILFDTTYEIEYPEEAMKGNIIVHDDNLEKLKKLYANMIKYNL